jgi:SAM-dependent methyltransferase
VKTPANPTAATESHKTPRPQRAVARWTVTAAVVALLHGTVADGQGTQGESEKADQAAPIPSVEYIPTPHDVAARMLALAGTGKDDVVCDLGCGDGRIVVAAAKTYGCRAVGVDIDPRRVRESRDNVRKNSVDTLVTIQKQDIFTVDVRPASVVTLYLSPKYNLRLLPELKNLRPGSRIVSHQFSIPGVEPDKAIRITSKEDGREHTVYLWRTPLRKRD